MAKKEKTNQDLINLQKAAIALSKATTTGKEVMESIGKAFTYSSFTRFAKDNKKVLIEDYTRQAIL